MKKMTLCLAALLFSVGIGAQTPKEEIPGFVMSQARETFQRYLEWKNGEETLTFPIITDIHAHDRQTWKHIGYMVETDKLFGYDFLANLGDIGLNINASHENKSYARQVLMNTKEQMGRYPGVFIYTPGNHDWDGGEGLHLSSAYLSDLFQKTSQKYAGENLHIVTGKAYGWYDVPGKNIRVVFLNSQATETLGENYYTFDDGEQLGWLRDLLNATPKDMGIVLLAHYMPHPIGRWTSVKDAVRPTCEILVHMMEAFVNREKGGELGLEWDFKKAGGRLVGLFTGDTHCNDFIKERGANFFISQGLGGVREDEKLPGQKHAEYDYDKSLCIDVIAIKLQSKEVKTFRIGAGGKDFDYTFTY